LSNVIDSTTRTAFVTGSTRGIGRGIAIALAECGFNIAVHGQSDIERAREVAAEMASFGVRTHALVGDIGNLSLHAEMVAEVERELGPLTCFVNNAGVGALRREDVLLAQEDSYDHCMLFNAKAAFFLTQAVARSMAVRPAGGVFRSIVMISSVSSQAASINRGEYCVSKAAASMVASVFAARMAEFGVCVFDVRPGIIETEMSRAALPAYQKRVDEENLTLIRRLGQPSDVGRTVASLASGYLPYITGQALNIDGGMSVQTL